MTEVLLLAVAVLLSLLCGAFVAAEFSLTTVERSDLEQAVERGERGASGALRAVRSLTFQLSGSQLGITVTNLVVGMLAEPSVSRLIRGPVEATGLSPSAAASVALVIGTGLSTLFLMVVGELVPKNWAISSPVAVAKVVATPQSYFTMVFKPFITHLNNMANRSVRRLGLEPTEELASARSPQELVALARHSVKEGALEPDTAELFVRTLSLAELTAENVMTPRVQVVALDVQATAEDVANATRATGLSRFPVHQGGLDMVVGTAHVKDVLAVPAEERPRRSVTSLMREPLLVPETLTVDRLLDRLTGRRTMAVVIDEYGGTAGVVTLEDIVEEVVGQVHDEHDPQETPDLVRIGEDAARRALWSVDGAVRTDQLETIGLRVPEGPYETIAGFVAAELGRIPEDGDTVDTEDGWHVEVADARGRRAARLTLRAPVSGDEDTGSDGDGGWGRGSGRRRGGADAPNGGSSHPGGGPPDGGGDGSGRPGGGGDGSGWPGGGGGSGRPGGGGHGRYGGNRSHRNGGTGPDGGSHRKNERDRDGGSRHPGRASSPDGRSGPDGGTPTDGAEGAGA